MGRTNKKLSVKARKSAAVRHHWALQWCWNYERMQAAGYAYAMVPVMKELYETEEEQCRELERHMVFYNTNPFASALIFGADVALEENYEGEIGDSLKVALMGPLAGIGDTISAVLLTPPFSIMAASLANEGSWLALIVATLPSLITFVARWPLFSYGYAKGTDIIADVSGSSSLDTLQTAASVLGMTVIGGFIPSIIGLKFKVKLGNDLVNEAGEVVQAAKTLQESLDAILPYLVPILVTAFCYWLIKVKKVTPLKTILLLFVLAFIMGAIGWM